ncbi:hypothetical protein MNBD_GAMMA18-1948 [hydrothermal vent metagenome]|uniref:Uncharacterized protein n=1 Tax=hydrothermal vent metagenome TaxID=652676 RepID=A0A3B0ZEX5_9ZZZZ
MPSELSKALYMAILILFSSIPLAYSAKEQQRAPCIECHQTSHLQSLTSRVDATHARAEISCLECHNSSTTQQGVEHYDYRLILFPGSSHCQGCHKK